MSFCNNEVLLSLYEELKRRDLVREYLMQLALPFFLPGDDPADGSDNPCCILSHAISQIHAVSLNGRC